MIDASSLKVMKCREAGVQGAVRSTMKLAYWINFRKHIKIIFTLRNSGSWILNER